MPRQLVNSDLHTPEILPTTELYETMSRMQAVESLRQTEKDAGQQVQLPGPCFRTGHAPFPRVDEVSNFS